MSNDFKYEIKEPEPVLIYEDIIRSNWNITLNEGSRFFEGKSTVQDAMRRVCKRIGDLGVPYAVVGGMALGMHGHPRFTDDVDLLVNAEGLKKIHEALEGSGYRPPFAGSKQLRDTDLGVKIEFLIAGEYPGDGKPKPVAFPEPEGVFIEVDGVRVINLEAFIELKLASGMTNINRLRDISDIQDLIRDAHLPRELGDHLNPFVADKYRELCDALATETYHPHGLE